jgi:hypothetical protein
MTDLDPLLVNALESLVPSFEDAPPDWADAVRRGRRSPGQRLALSGLAIGVVLVALLVAPAFGLGRGVLPFFSAEKAPQPVVLDFASMSTGAPPGRDPGVIASATRKVGRWYFGSKTHTLWVAPTRAGGFCDLWTDGAGGGCDREGTVPVSAIGAMAPTQVPPGLKPRSVGVLKALDNGIPIWVAGYVRAKYAAGAEIRFEDGAVVRPELTWVSEPIGAGFFAYDIPAAHRVLGHRAVSVLALDAHGERMATNPLGVGGQDDPLADALMDERHAAATLATRHGTATLYTAPTRYEGRCSWLELGSEAIPVKRCLPKGYEHQAALALSVHSLGTRLILAGECGYRAVEFVHSDGTTRAIACTDGLVFTELTSADAAGEVQALDVEGRPLPGSRIAVPRLRPAG